MSAAPAQPGAHDLLIVGAGTLAEFLADEWHALHPSATITAENRTSRAHASLRLHHVQPVALNATYPVPPFVVFCAPPGADYAAHVARLADRVPQAARLVLTSSGGVYGNVSAVVDERSGVGDTPRAKELAAAERAALAHPNAAVLRLAGLYHMRRGGAHNSMLQAPAMPFPPTHVFNMIHYADAARAVVCALRLSRDALRATEDETGRTFVVSVREATDVRRSCEVALMHPNFADGKMPHFADGISFPAKVYSNEWSRKVLGWTPRWESYEQFMLEDAENTRLAQRERVVADAL